MRFHSSLDVFFSLWCCVWASSLPVAHRLPASTHVALCSAVAQTNVWASSLPVAHRLPASTHVALCNAVAQTNVWASSLPVAHRMPASTHVALCNAVAQTNALRTEYLEYVFISSRNHRISWNCRVRSSALLGDFVNRFVCSAPMLAEERKDVELWL